MKSHSSVDVKDGIRGNQKQRSNREDRVGEEVSGAFVNMVSEYGEHDIETTNRDLKFLMSSDKNGNWARTKP